MIDIENKNLNYILKHEDLKLGDIILQSGHKPHSFAIKQYTQSNFSHANRHIENYKNSLLNYDTTHLTYHKLHSELYKELLGVSLSRFITLFNVAKKLILEKCRNEIVMIVMLQAQQNIKVLEDLRIVRYEK